MDKGHQKNMREKVESWEEIEMDRDTGTETNIKTYQETNTEKETKEDPEAEIKS